MKKMIFVTCLFLCLLMFVSAFAATKSWDCPSCGKKGITTNFCDQCGTKAPSLWTCSVCGNKDNSGLFCPNCGTKRELPFANEVEWLGKPIESVAKDIEALGYKPIADNKTGLFKDVAWIFTNESEAPMSISAWFDSDDRIVTRITNTYNKNAELFNQINQSLTKMFGQPRHTDYKEEQTAGSISITFESLSWAQNSIGYLIGFTEKPDGTNGSMEATLKGDAGFSVSVLKTSEAKAETLPTPTATQKPRPTATPKPVNVEVAVYSVDIKDNRFGRKEFYIRFKNNSSQTIDRIDFKVQGFNRYGERITSYIFDTASFYYDEILQSGQITPDNYYYNNYYLNEATRIRIAITKYHTSSGYTIEVPESQLHWETFDQ